MNDTTADAITRLATEAEAARVALERAALDLALIASGELPRIAAARCSDNAYAAIAAIVKLREAKC